MDQKFLSDTIHVFILAAAENADGVNTLKTGTKKKKSHIIVHKYS